MNDIKIHNYMRQQEYELFVSKMYTGLLRDVDSIRSDLHIDSAGKYVGPFQDNAFTVRTQLNDYEKRVSPLVHKIKMMEETFAHLREGVTNE
jgi:hypothetical protein